MKREYKKERFFIMQRLSDIIEIRKHDKNSRTEYALKGREKAWEKR